MVIIEELLASFFVVDLILDLSFKFIKFLIFYLIVKTLTKVFGASSCLVLFQFLRFIVLLPFIFFLKPGQLLIDLFQFCIVLGQLVDLLHIVAIRILSIESRHSKLCIFGICRNGDSLGCREIEASRLRSSRYFYLRRLILLNFHIILILALTNFF